MPDTSRTNQELIEENLFLKQRIQQLEKSEIKRQHLDEELEASEEKYKFLVETTNTGYVIINGDGLVSDANEEYVRISGHDRRDEILGRSVVEWTAPYDQARNAAEVKKCFTNGCVRNLEIDYVDKHGRVTSVELNANLIASGDIARIFTLCRDITERKRAREKLREKEEKYRVLFEAANDGIFIHDGTGFIDCNKKGAEMYGLPKDKIIGHSPIDFSPLRQPDGRLSSEVAGERVRAVLNGVPQVFEWQALRADGITLDVEITLSRLELDGLVCLQAIVRDITARKAAEAKIRQSEEFIRGILDTVDEGFIVINRDYRILTANKAYRRQEDGWGDEEIIGQHCYEVSHRINRPCFEEGEECAVREVFETGKPGKSLHKHPGPDGQVIYVETKAFPMKDSAGEVTSVIETINNVTEKNLLEEERLKTQKLESIGILAGGIAHDFNNLLQGIFGYISMAKMTFDQKDKSLAMLEQAEKALQQSVNLTTQLLTFSRGGKPVKKSLSLKPVIENAVKFALSGSRTDSRLDVDPALWYVNGDAGQLGQVIQNIVLNADQAMPLGGVVKISARNVAAGDTAQPSALARGNHVEIAIEDNGVGIPEQYLDKIFDPYFTTKEKGSGLGLATSYSIIRNHDGQIRVVSEVSKGTLFCLSLPALTNASAVQADRSAAPSATRKARVLVMDDEELIRSLATEQLQELGHDVEVAAHGEATLAKYQEAAAAGRPFDVVILDLTIRGGMGGLETVQKLVEIDPGVKAVVSSGYSADASIANYRQHGFQAFLKKPYNMQELQSLLSSQLAQ